MPPKKVSDATATAASDRPRRAAAVAKPASEPTPAELKKRKAAAKSATEPAKKRGRPGKAAAAKAKDEDADEESEEAPAPKKKRGPPAKAAPKKEAVAGEGKAAPKKRGRPPKGGETTKASVDDEAAEQQLEGELAGSAGADAADAGAAETGELVPPPEPKRFWLMKAEQEDREETAHNGAVINTKFTIDDLRAKTAPELWDGVRNVVAAKNMRAMRKGDLAFFYASGGKRGRTPGIVGIMEVMSEAEHDVTTAAEGAYGYVADEKTRGKWCVVGVEYRKKLSTPVSLKELQQHRDVGGKLEGMQLFRQSRLSVAQVKPEEWRFIVEEMIEGYE
ncbi:hypothetical protein LTR53_015634 [Teratosphaeriaceae sp. CCFEE 6253]|nr:hypothetical protein LTR53_015634 [Teratosphaeriaceae sp. CCFEE 6253]